ncbi:MAG TPA: hypothetical protein GX497_01855, partial [Bacillus bacterium]|nr:hypothetical protein [Bacillus sp. (in: firmicutes)]
MASKKEKFSYGPASGLMGLSVILIPIMSAIPTWSLKIFMLNVCLATFLTLLARYLYEKIPEEYWYNSLVNYFITSSMGFYAVTPFLRITYHFSLFWLFLFLYVFILVFTVFKREMIFQAFHKPGESKLAIGTIIV